MTRVIASSHTLGETFTEKPDGLARPKQGLEALRLLSPLVKAKEKARLP